MTVRDLGELRPETAAAVCDYLARLEAGLCEVRRALAAETIDETRTHFLDALDAAATPDDVRAVGAGLGEPDAYAAALCVEISGQSARTPDVGPGSRTVLGMPYEWRLPTSERVRAAWWDPSNPSIMVPRVFGIGWDVNFGALAVRLHLIRPDDEEEPFASVPEVWMRVALGIPVVLTLGMAVAWWLAADSLPAELPVHWGLSGPDRFSSAGEALAPLMALAGLPTLWAVWTYTRRQGGSRAVVSAFASLLAAVSAWIFAATLLWVYAWVPAWFMPVGIIGSLAVPFAMLVSLARINRQEEWKRELGSPGTRSETERNR